MYCLICKSKTPKKICSKCKSFFSNKKEFQWYCEDIDFNTKEIVSMLIAIVRCIIRNYPPSCVAFRYLELIKMLEKDNNLMEHIKTLKAVQGDKKNRKTPKK